MTTRQEAKPDSMLVPAGVHPYDALRDMVAPLAHPGARVIDVGAGDGGQEYPSWLSQIEGHVVGIDPSAAIYANHGLDERHQASLEEFAATHPRQFDIAVASFVAEHVADPEAFLAGLHQCLRPGGSAFILTPHVMHYFGAGALVAHRLRVDEWLLHRLRDEATLDERHCPLEYRMNTRRRLARLARRAGFCRIEFHMLELAQIYEPYFPRLLRPFPAAWSAAVHRLNTPALAGTILARLETPQPI